MRAVWRRLRRVAIGALALVVIVLGAGLITAHTACGREQLRSRMEAALRDAFPDGARVASLEGSVLGTLTLRGVEVEGPGGTWAVRAGAVRAAVALWPLLFHTAQIDRLTAEDLHVVVRAVPRSPPPPAPTEPSPWRIEVVGATVRGATVELSIGSAAAAASGAAPGVRPGVRPGVAIDELDVAGGLTLAAGRAVVSGVVHGRWSRGGGPRGDLTASASIQIARGVEVPAILAFVDGATIAATDVRADLEHPRGAIAVAAPTAAIARLTTAASVALPVEPPGDVAAAISLDDDGPDTTHASVTARAGDTVLRAIVRGEPARRTARVLASAEAIDLALLTSGRVRGRGHALAGFAAGSAGARGALIAHGDVELPDLPLRRGAIAMIGSLDDAKAVVVGAGDDALAVAGVAPVQLRSGVLAVADAHASVTARGLRLPCAPGDTAAADAPGCRHVTGELRAEARITGTLVPRLQLAMSGMANGTRLAIEPPRTGGNRITLAAVHAPFRIEVAAGNRVPRVTIAGKGSASGLTVDDLSVAAVGGSYSLGVLPEPRLDRMQLAATGIRRAGRVLGHARVDLERRNAADATGAVYDVAATARPPVDGVALAVRALVRPVGSTYDAALGLTRVALPDGTAWAGGGGRVVVSDPTDAARMRVRLRGLTLHRGDATAALRGEYAGATGALAAHVEADRLELASLDPQARGVARGSIDLARRAGAWQIEAALAARAFAMSPGAPPIDATAHVVVARQRVALEAHATGEALGAIDVGVDAGAPRDPFDRAAWQRLDRDAIRTAEITARQVSLPRLAALVGRAMPAALAPTGTIDGTVDLAPGALRGGFAVRGMRLQLDERRTPGDRGDRGDVGPLDGDLTFVPDGNDLGLRGNARLAGIGGAEVTARLTVPRYPLDPATWQRRGRDLVRDAAADLEDVAFDPELLARVGIAGWLARRDIAAPYRGRVRGHVALGAAVGAAQLSLDLIDVTGGVIVAPVSPRLAVDVGAAGTHVHLGLRAGGLDLGALDGQVPMTAERWLIDPAAVLRAPVEAQWTLPATPLVPVLALFGRRGLDRGTVEGAATIRGTVGTPIVPEVHVVARDVVVTPPLGGRPLPALGELVARASWGGASGSATLDARESNGGALHAVINGRPDAIAAASGTVELRRLDVAPLAALLPGALVSAAGIVDGDVALRDGRVTGKVGVSNGRLPLASKIGTLHSATGELRSDGRTITGSLAGRLGTGKIELSADAPADLSTATVHLQLDEVSPIMAVRPLVTARATARVRRDGDQLRGEVTVERGTVELTGKAGAQLLEAALPADLVFAGGPIGTAPSAPAAPAALAAPAHPWLVLDVQPGSVAVSAREINEGVGFTGSAVWPPDEAGILPCGPANRLRVSLGDTVGVCGKVALRSDDVELFGRRYSIEPTAEGDSGLLFDGTTDALIKLRMSHRFTDLALAVDVGGRLSSIGRPRFSSDGNYTENQLFAYFLGGEPGGDAALPTGFAARGAVAGAGTRLVSGWLGREIGKLLSLPIDTLSCEPDPLATTTTSGSCTVGKWLSERVFLGYRQRLQPRPDENTGDAQLEVRMGDGLLLDTTGGDRNHYGLDLLWGHRW